MVLPSRQVSLYLCSQHLQQEYLPTFRSRTCWFRSRCEPKILFCHEKKIPSWSQHRNVHGDSRPSHPGLGRSSCFHESTLSHGMIPKVFSRHDPFISSGASSSRVMKNCPLSIFFKKKRDSIGTVFGQFLLFKKLCEFVLVFTQEHSLYFRISLRIRVHNKKFCRYHHWCQIIIRDGFPCTWWVSG